MVGKHTVSVNRRRVLAGIGATGVGAFTGGRHLRGQFSAAPPSYTHHTYAASEDDATRTVGDALEAAYVDGYETDTDGPLVAETNVLPGDSSGISIGLSPEGMDARVRLPVTGGGPDATVSGSLSEVTDVVLWYDTGLFGIGGRPGERELPAKGALESSRFGRSFRAEECGGAL